MIPTGEKLLSYTEKILQLLEDATKAAMDTGTPSGTLKLGSSHTAAAVYVPNILADYHKTYPLVDLSLITGHSNDLVQQVLHFELDGAFVNSPVVHPDIVEEIVFHEVLVLATAKTESNKSCINHKPILMNSAGCQYRSQIEDWLHAEGIMTPRMMEFNTMDAIIGGVIANLGFSLIPKSNVQKLEEAGLVNTFPVPSPYCSVNTGFVRHKEALLTSTLVEFISLLGEHSKLIFPPN
ncbi:DNA-binding transcriptional LysR family regulator [Fontibacillus solani]|uniref:DNA-binding transcriptional LysR family regulator n=1 Tax=Fontibacillus solani TaxID=1572857 RepID=A0A7W3XQD5_9BACL|nr:LysR substrate-binding domain-containing protein [Fontibacillus solani]MBA9084350.1 DNA-binding transcriptional LysR family regulator [Fontibacillus solani]